MNLPTHAITERRVHQPMTLNLPFTGKCVRHHQGFEMHAIVAADLHVRIRQARKNQAVDVAGLHRGMIPKSSIIRRMLMPAIAVIAGFGFLAWGADRFVAGAAGTARNLGMSPLFVGLTIVGLGTSAPEMLVSVVAALNGNPGIAVGNALGSNITNCALVLGVAALVAPLTLRSKTIKREFPVLFLIIAISWFLVRDGDLMRGNGFVLVASVVPLLVWMFWIGKRGEADHDAVVSELPALSLTRSLVWLTVGLGVLLVSSRAVVWGAATIAELWGVSDTIIGLSVIAIGTSLPELAASIVAALRDEHDIAVGNVLGSNMFNLLVVLGIPGLVAPGRVDPEVLTRDFPVMLAITLAVAAMAFMRSGPAQLGRPAGATLVVAFVCYQWLLYS